jgi:formylglycine-generating enzyme required for sulfatase activity
MSGGIQQFRSDELRLMIILITILVIQPAYCIASEITLYDGQGEIPFVVVPEGIVRIGCPPDEAYQFPLSPAYKPVTVSEFAISKYEITNRQYYTFVLDGGYTNPDYWLEDVFVGMQDTSTSDYRKPLSYAIEQDTENIWNQPIYNINYHEAAAYCMWLTQKTGYDVDIPTLPQWEYAAEGPTKEGQIVLFPWGDLGFRNLIDEIDLGVTNTGLNYFYDRFDAPCVGGAMPVDCSWIGCYDLCGNVREWNKPYLEDSIVRDSMVIRDNAISRGVAFSFLERLGYKEEVLGTMRTSYISADKKVRGPHVGIRCVINSL